MRRAVLCIQDRVAGPGPSRAQPLPAPRPKRPDRLANPRRLLLLCDVSWDGHRLHLVEFWCGSFPKTVPKIPVIYFRVLTGFLSPRIASTIAAAFASLDAETLFGHGPSFPNKSLFKAMMNF